MRSVLMREKMRWISLLLVLLVLLLWSEILLACHKGGPMGFADNDPGAFSLDISSSPTYVAASTVGTAGCKNWDYARQQQLHFLQNQWSILEEDASRGSGEHLVALARIMGCTERDRLDFTTMVHNDYSSLFNKAVPDINFLHKLVKLSSRNQLLSCTG
ncbi:MAG: hypothetical protein MAG581_00677 [Deltaproteobacteria bacterium]|nr:hypothetical protein [Deltaproteobacteria bacterium]